MFPVTFCSPTHPHPRPLYLSYYINSHVNANRNPTLESPDPQSGFPLNISTQAFSSLPASSWGHCLHSHQFHWLCRDQQKICLLLHSHFFVLPYLPSMLHQFTFKTSRFYQLPSLHGTLNESFFLKNKVHIPYLPTRLFMVLILIS